MTSITNIKTLTKCLNNKRVREILTQSFVDENPIITEAVIDHWGLKRIDAKYRKKTRLYDENSYSKQKIREEELIFIKRHALFQPLRYYFEEQRILQDILFTGLSKHENFDIDDKFYRSTIIDNFKLDYPRSPLIVKKNNRHRIDVTNDILEISNVREICINEYLENFSQLTLLIIEEFNLKFITYKYINNIITKFESSYTRNKIKVEELFLLNKIYQYSLWLKHIDTFNELKKGLFNENEFKQENTDNEKNNYFLNAFVENVIAEFRDGDFDIADDINFN